MTAPDTLSAGEAADLLGVSRATLYAYVSRGLVASEPGPGPSRARRYPRAALEAFRDRRARSRDRGLAAHGALHWGLPVLDSALTLIEGGRCHYRGHEVVALSREEPFERVAALLWTGDPAAAADLFAALPASTGAPGGPEPTALAAHLAAAAAGSVVSPSSGDAALLRGAVRVTAGAFAAAGAAGEGTLAARLARGWGVPDAAGDIDAALVLCADHELNVSSFTARCVASADASLEDVVLAALCALRGRRHGGLTARVESMAADADRDGAAATAARWRGGDGALPGFGHPLYPDGDPRGAELLRRAALPEDDPVSALVRIAHDQLGEEPTLDLGLAALARGRGMPPGAAFHLFALGRCAGWVAHALETVDDDRLIRPRSRYVGPPPGG
ncbi:MAG: citrate synthase family protein [Thermoleophilia bacterium]